MPRSQYTTAGLALLLTALPSTRAAPLSPHLYKRELSGGAKAGIGVGIALVALTLIAIIVFFIVHFHRRAHLSKINKERAMLAGEKNADGSDKIDKFASENSTAGLPRRQKSVKDRLMGPLYRGSTIDMMPLPKAYNPNRESTMTTQSGDASFLSKPWAQGGESSPRPSFSSKRATRMMMMM